MIDNFNWLGEKLPCYNEILVNSNAVFYKEFALNNEVYSIGNFVVINDSNTPQARSDPSKDRIARLLCTYESNELWHKNRRERAIVKWYTFARKINKKHNFSKIDFNKTSEVVEDLCEVDIYVYLGDIKRKGNVIFATELDSKNYIQEEGLDKTLYFLCRFRIMNDRIEPIMSEEYLLKANIEEFTNLNLDSCIVDSNNCITNHEITPAKRNTMPKKRKSILQPISDNTSPTKLIKLNLVRKYDDEYEIKNKINGSTEKKYASPNKNDKSPNSTNITKFSPNKNNGSSNKILKNTPGRRSAASAKRNLNESFAENECENSPAVLNYSIVDQDIDESEALKLKLKVSDKPIKQSNEIIKSPTVLMNKLCDEIVDLHLNNTSRRITRRTSTTVQELLTPRRSSRKITRKSYADYISPIKTYKGFRSSLDEDNDKSFNPNKTESKTPRKSDFDEAKTPKKKEAKTPKKSESKKTDLENSTEALLKTSRKTPKRQAATKASVLMEISHSEYSNSDSDVEMLPSPKKKPLLRSTIIERRKSILKHVTEDVKVSTPKKSVNFTPNKAKLIREGVITPSVQSRERAVEKANTPLSKARSQLHVSYVPKILPCREKEFDDIYNFLEGKLWDKCGGCMYISGVPGTGKTATTTEVIKKLQKSARDGDVPEFDYVNINGMHLTEPRQAYVEILKQLGGRTVPWEQAQSILDEKFTKKSNSTKSKSNKKGKNSYLPVVLVVDELDILCTKRQDVVYNLLDWPTKASNQLIVITIANTMDLPERLLMSRVTSRLGLTRLTFQAYTHKQLQEIVTKRLIGTDAFNSDAIQLVARKVASVSGDARRALDICRRAAEIAEREGPKTLVSFSHVNEALNEMITQPKVQAIKRCSRLEKLILQSVVAEVERTGVEETTFIDIYNMLHSVAAIDGFQLVTMTVALTIVSRLGAYRLLLTEQQKCNDMYQKIMLNVSADDVYYALRTES